MYIFNIKVYLLLIPLVCCLLNQKKVLRIDRFEICELPPTSPFNTSYMHVKRAGYGTVIDASFELSRDILTIKIITKVTRCHNREQLDSCEFFTTIAFKNACAYMAAKNSIFSTFIYAYKPPYICPLLKGTYVCTNGTFDPSLVTFFPLENFYWKVEQLVYDASSDEYLYKMCVDSQVIVFRE